MKKICVITAARSEYGLLKWIMKDIDSSDEFNLQLIVTGAHLMESQGHTIDQIKEDGFRIDECIDPGCDANDTDKIANIMANMTVGASMAYKNLQPDYVLVLGDRYELLPFGNVAYLMQIPIIHISGGDVTEGALDDGIRNAVTMLATYHFPGTEDSRQNIIRMRGNDLNVWNVGEPGLDAFSRERLMDRNDLADNLGLAPDHIWTLFTYHPETTISVEENLANARIALNAMLEQDIDIVATYANADLGGKQINEMLETMAEENPNRLKVIPALGQHRYLSFMKQCRMVVGNSSSGIVEAPTLGIPVVNIGKRQKGRHLCENIIQVDDIAEVRSAIVAAMSRQVCKCSDADYWGDTHASERIVEILKSVL